MSRLGSMFTSHRLSACRVRTTRYFSHSRSPSRSEPIYSHLHNTILTHSPVSLLISRGVIQRLPPRSPHLPLRVGAQPTAVAASRHLRPLHRVAESCSCPPASMPRWRVGAGAALGGGNACTSSRRLISLFVALPVIVVKIRSTQLDFPHAL